MTVNHIGHVFEPNFHPKWWEFTYLTIGKLTFPIMAYLLLEGLKYTKSFPKYLGRLLGYGILSILPFHFALQSTEPIYWFNNVLFTLATGLFLIKLSDSIQRPFKNKTSFIEYLLLIIAMLITIKSDWNLIGVLLIWMLYKHPDNITKTISIFAVTVTIIEYLGTSNIMTLNYLGLLLVIPILNNYNGTKGFTNNIIKYGFYIYYPLHLTILWLISLYLNW